jgi:hypothetical protein
MTSYEIQVEGKFIPRTTQVSDHYRMIKQREAVEEHVYLAALAKKYK